MTLKISGFFKQAGFPLHNVRWSWGANTRDGVLLRAWADDVTEDGGYVQVLRAPGTYGKASSGLGERIDHLRMLWAGGLAGYAVIATAEDTQARPRVIASFDTSEVIELLQLVADPEGGIWARLGDAVPIDRLAKHARDHRLTPASGSFPTRVDASMRRQQNPSVPYVQQLPAMREWLIAVARRRGKVTYAEARAPFGLWSLTHRHAMERIGRECEAAGEPILTSLIIDAKTKRCGPGFFKAFGRDDRVEREDCYAFWSEQQPQAPNANRTPTQAPLDKDELRNRARHFAQARPEQAAFRRRLFIAHDGACFVTGCRIVQALDAAHRRGRIWSAGHNQAEDGYLLRKDIHGLYDAGLIDIENDGALRINSEAVAAHYAHLKRTSEA